MKIPDNLQISVYHEGILLLLYHSSYGDLVDTLSNTKKQGELVEEITTWTDYELLKKYGIHNLSIGKTSAWGTFLEELSHTSQRYGELHPIVLGSIIEIMDNLNWQSEFDHRKFLTFYLDSNEELAHLKLATVGTEFAFLESWRNSIIEEAQGYAAYKSKIA